MLKNYLKIALRNLLKQKTYAFINISGLSLGLACCILILIFVQHEWSYDNFHQNKERLYRVFTAQKKPDGTVEKYALQPIPLRDALLAEYPEILRAARFIDSGTAFVRYGDKIFGEDIYYSDEDVFRMFTFPFAAGDPQTALHSPNAIVISEAMAKKYFGDEDPLGRVLTITISNQDYEHVVTAVMRDIPENSSIRFDFLAPMQAYPVFSHPHYVENWNSSRLWLYLELSENASVAALEAKLPALVNKYLGRRIADGREDGSLSKDADAWQLRLQPLPGVHLNPEIRWGMQPAGNPLYIYILLGISLLVLLIACINFMTLAVGRSAGRAREVGVRKVFGALRRQLMQQFWGESLLMVYLALLFGIALAELFLPAFNSLVGQNLRIPLGGNWTVWLGLTALLILVALIAGSYPALFLSAFKPVDVMKNAPLSPHLLSAKRKAGLREALVVVQFSLSIGFIICTFIMLKQMDFIRNKDLGFDKNAVLAVSAYSRDLESIEVLERFRNEVSRYPQIINVSGGTVSFNRGWSIQRWLCEGQHRDVWEFRVDHNYQATLELELREGRFFSGEISGDVMEAVVVNETLVETFGWEYPVVGKKLDGWGKHVSGHSSDPTIIGVVKDYNFSSLRESIQPMVLHQTPDWPLRYILVRINPGDVSGALTLLKETWQKVHPNAPFNYSFIDEDIANQYFSEQRWSKILTYSSLFAIVIAAMGLFGLASLSVARRTKEIGIRKVLGASVASIISLINREFLLIVLAANLIAWPAAWYVMNSWLQDFAYRIEISWWVFVLAGGLALLIALLTVSVQAVKAALANPVESLRYE